MAQQYNAVNSYFVPGYGISRAIIQSEIRYFCGPDAIVRPYTHQVRDDLVLKACKQLTELGSRWLPCHNGWSSIDKGSHH